MGRLIDESELIDIIQGSEELLDFQKDECIECIKACDTAYDPDRVVQQIRRFGTMLKAGMIMRKLPQYAADKFVTCKIIRNTQARFCNRVREAGWLTPSAEQLVETHVNVVRKIQKFLPVTDVTLEVKPTTFRWCDVSPWNSIFLLIL